MQPAPHGLLEFARVAARADEQATIRRVELRRGQVIVVARISAETLLFDVLGDADHIRTGESSAIDGVTAPRSLAHLDALPDRILSGPEHLPHGFAHHHCARRLRGVVIAEPAPSKDARPDRREVL